MTLRQSKYVYSLLLFFLFLCIGGSVDKIVTSVSLDEKLQTEKDFIPIQEKKCAVLREQSFADSVQVMLAEGSSSFQHLFQVITKNNKGKRPLPWYPFNREGYISDLRDRWMLFNSSVSGLDVSALPVHSCKMGNDYYVFALRRIII